MRVPQLWLAAALFLCACGAASRLLGTSSPTPLPWVAATPGPRSVATPAPPEVVPRGTPICTAHDLVASLGRSMGLSGGQQTLWITFRNRQPFACFVDGQPAIQLLDATGHVLPINTPALDWRRSGPVLVEANSANQPPGPGEAMVGLFWGAHDGSGACPNLPPPAAAVRVELAGGGLTLEVDAQSAPYGLIPCGRSVGVTVFQTIEPPPPVVPPTPVRCGRCAAAW